MTVETTKFQCPHCDIPTISEAQLRSHTWLAHPETFNVASKSPTDEEQAVLDAANALASARANFSEEVMRLIVSGQKSYDAQHAAQFRLGNSVLQAEAQYEIAKARLNRT